MGEVRIILNIELLVNHWILNEFSMIRREIIHKARVTS